jgi:hypothetical protein
MEKLRGIAYTELDTGIPVEGTTRQYPPIPDVFDAVIAGATVSVTGTTLTVSTATPFDSNFAALLAQAGSVPIQIGGVVRYVTALDGTHPTYVCTIDKTITASTSTLALPLEFATYRGPIQLDTISEPGRVLAFAQSQRCILESEQYQ